MGNQSIVKTVFLLVSMVGWLIVGATLMYLFPVIVDRLISSDLTHLWMVTLSHSAYNPLLAGAVGGIALIVTVMGTIVWYQRFDDKT